LARETLLRARSQLVTNDTGPLHANVNRRIEPIRAEFARLSRHERTAVINERQQATDQRAVLAVTFGIGGLVFVVVVAVGVGMYLRPRSGLPLAGGER
jgi:hypothetical protein